MEKSVCARVAVMILEVDIGNTRIKWRLRKGRATLEAQSHVHYGRFDYDAWLASIDVEPCAVFIVTVIVEQKQRFTEWFCRRSWSCPLVFAEVSRECAGVINGYRELSQMGPDRWLAMVAAFDRFGGPCVVVDCGSACTVDVLQASGKHLGGYIVPGLSLMREALFRDTDRVKLLELNYDDASSLGRSTQEAVASGTRIMLLGMIAEAIESLLRAGEQQPLLVVTGGVGDKLRAWLRVYLQERGLWQQLAGIESAPELVFDGLPLVCETSRDEDSINNSEASRI